MRVGVIGAGHIGGNIAHFLACAGHEVTVSFSREPGSLERLAGEIGPRASAGSPAAVAGSGVVVISVPWPSVNFRPGQEISREWAKTLFSPARSIFHDRDHARSLARNRACKRGDDDLPAEPACRPGLVEA